MQTIVQTILQKWQGSVAGADFCTVYERFNKEQIGKGYALDFLLENIKNDFPNYKPDAFLIFDADNLLDKNYIYEINKAFDSGEEIITSYRNSKNFTSNWIAANTAMQFMRECRFVHTPRAILKTSTFVSGTGFLVNSNILNTETGWKYTTLTEDIEFSASSVIKGKKISYCDDAVFYDEQPTTFKASWNQRMRWQKGFYQCFAKYFYMLFLSLFSKNSFASYEISLFLFPFAPVMFFWNLLYSCYGLVYSLTSSTISGLPPLIIQIISALVVSLLVSFVFLFLYGMLILVTERKRVKTTLWQKIKYSATFPIFILSYLPIAIVCLFQKVTWKQIPHTDSRTIHDISK